MMALRVPEMVIEEKEAAMLAGAIARVEQYYPRIREIVTGKMAAHGALLLAIGQVYGTRFVAITTRLKMEKDQEAKGGGTVLDMTGKFRPETRQ